MFAGIRQYDVMAEVLEKYFCMFPNTAYMLIEGWLELGIDVVIVEDEGRPASVGESHAALLVQGKVTENFIRTGDLPESGIIRSTIAVKFEQRDTYLNENPLHYFCRFLDNSGANQLGALYYEGIDVNNNRIGIEDASGFRTVLDTGPFVAGQWLTLDSLWRHNGSAPWRLFRNGTEKGTVSGGDFFTTAGDIQIKPQGQEDNGPLGPGGRTWCSFVAHYTDVPFPNAAPLYAKFMFRPYNHYGEAVCDHEGNTPAPALLSGDGSMIWDNATTVAQYRTTGITTAKGGAWPCDRDIDRSGPGGRFSAGTTPVACNGCYWTDHSIKGGDDDDPHTLIGKANNDVDSFTIVETDIARGFNVKSQKLLVPGDTGFPGIDEYAMLGILERQKTMSIGTLGLEETLMSYLVLDSPPKLTTVKVLGDTFGLGETVAAA